MAMGLTVAKQPKAKSGSEISEEQEGKKSSLKVKPGIQRIISKVAAHRNMSIESLFEEDDVQTFFKHLLIAEMKKEEKHLQEKMKT